LAEVAECNLVGALILRGESCSSCEWNLTTDDCVSAKKAEALIEHVHRDAFAFRAAGGFAVKLSHDGPRRHALGECETMFAIAREHVVVFSDGGDRADADSFLADVQVTEATDFTGDVNFGRLLFEATDQEHLPVEFN